MTTWGTDDLTQFLDRVHLNKRVNREKFTEPYSLMQRIDSCSNTAGYALAMFADPALEVVFASRHIDDASMKRRRKNSRSARREAGEVG